MINDNKDSECTDIVNIIATHVTCESGKNTALFLLKNRRTHKVRSFYPIYQKLESRVAIFNIYFPLHYFLP